MSEPASRRFQTIVTTAALTSLVWLGLGFWLWANRTGTVPGGDLFAVHSDSPSGAPVRKPPVRQDARPPAARAPLVVSSSRLVIPVAGVGAAQLVDTFTQARNGGARRHDAIDIMAPRGTPVLAAAGGQVEKLFVSKAGGLTIYVRTPDRTAVHYYAHLDAYAPDVREGMTVRAGQQIGTVGITGNANPAGPHLHFAIWRMQPNDPWFHNGEALNPYPLLAR